MNLLGGRHARRDDSEKHVVTPVRLQVLGLVVVAVGIGLVTIAGGICMFGVGVFAFGFAGELSEIPNRRSRRG